MAKIDAANTLMFGSEDDAIYLGEYTPKALDSLTDLKTAVPSSLEDMGWISEDGLQINLDDSSDKIKGHQGHGVVRLYMKDSETSIEVSLLEAKAKTLAWNLDAEVSVSGSVAKFVAPAARATKDLMGVIDGFDANGSGTQWRVILPHLTLGERDGISMKVGDLTVFKFTLEVIDGFTLLTNGAAAVSGAGAGE